MKAILHRIFIVNFPRKLVAFASALVIWFLVNQSITVTKTFTDVSVRVVNLPADKTIVGLLPTGILQKKIPVTLTGSKASLNDLAPSDFEIVINAEGRKESWIAHIDTKNIVSLNFDNDLQKNLTKVTATNLYLKVSRLVTEEIPLTIRAVGDPPPGYQFLDVWPAQLFQKVTGSADEVLALKEQGLELTFHLSNITKATLDAAYEALKNPKADEIGIPVPESWKMVAIPFREEATEPLNDPRATLLRIDFLRQELIPLNVKLPVSLFFPLKYSTSINPETYHLAPSHFLEKKNGLDLLDVPLFVSDVSRLFLEVVKDNIELTIIAVPKRVQSVLDWTVTFINPKALEDAYIAANLAATEERYDGEFYLKNSEHYLRCRFQDYMSRFVLYINSERALELVPQLNANTITLSLPAP